MYEYLDKRYALALYQVAQQKGKVEEYLEDLREIVKLIKNDEDFIKVIKHPQIGTAQKRDLFTKIFKGKIDDELLSFLLILIDKDRILYLEEKLKEMEKIHLEEINTLKAYVTTVIPLSEEEKKELIKKLENQYKKNIIIEEKIDPKILGGICVRISDDIIDGTIRTKLNEMRKVMLD